MDHGAYPHISKYLPTTAKEVKALGWEELDVILFTGDAYVDHPAFGIPVIGRVLEEAGYRVAIIPQPNWQDDLRDFKKLGKPRLFFGVSAGAMDSMVNHYTARKRRRSTDAYTPGNVSGFRPDYPTSVYTAALKQHFPDTPVILGGVEASLRRLTHYDYWEDRLRPGILCDSGADMITYGMAEHTILELAKLLDNGVPFGQITGLGQTVILRSAAEARKIIGDKQVIRLHAHEECLRDKRKFAENFAQIETASNMMHPGTITQKAGRGILLVNPPITLPEGKDLDRIYDLPYTRLPHPKYQKKNPIPAYEMIRHSINIHRGCFGGCSFCTISAHQGKFVQSRTKDSILREVKQVADMPDFVGYISDLGGPSANMYRMKGFNEEICGKCKRPSCLYPSICKNLDTDHRPLTSLYHEASKVKGIKKISIGSGIRYDFLKQNNDINHFRKYFRELVKNHVSGRLKVAPEHSAKEVLDIMRKPDYHLFDRLYKDFKKINSDEGLNQQIIPYVISSHPHCSTEDMAELALTTKQQGYRLEQVQDFTPTPMTLATVMYYSGYNPYTLKKVVTAKTTDEKSRQLMFFFWYKKEYRQVIKRELIRMGRQDLLSKLINA
ncbi:MAG: YgiQ family radical SAM protein [Bacteroidetes bacterium]|nr:YgiQ family radical SAM protein [Bacteroidota bacterium]